MKDPYLTPQTSVDSLNVANLKKNPAALYLLSLRSESGRYQMMRKLEKVARIFGGESWQSFAWESLDSVHVNAVITRLAQDYKPSYVNAILAAIRGVMEFAYDHQLIGESTYRLIRKVKRVKGGETEPTGRYLPSGERTAIMEICLSDSSPAGFRDAAILACAYPGGLRRTEIVELNREDITDDGDTLTLKVTGKGNKKRRVFMNNGGADAIRDYLVLRGSATGPLFYAGRKGGNLIEGQRITGQSVYEMLKRRSAEAGIRDLGTHDFRRTTASDLLDISDTVTVAGYLGHASTNTTAKYDRRGERARKKAAQGLHISYRQRDFDH